MNGDTGFGCVIHGKWYSSPEEYQRLMANKPDKPMSTGKCRRCGVEVTMGTREWSEHVCGAKEERIKSQAELDAILSRDDWTVIRGDRGTVLALVPRGLSPQGWQRLFDYVLDKYKNLSSGRKP